MRLPAAAASMLLLLAAAGQGAAAGEGVPAFSIAPLRAALEPDAKVGRKSAGLICGPAGSLRWKDVRPDTTEVEKVAARAMRARGIDLFVPSEEWLDESGPPTAFRLVPTVDALTLRLCTPHAGPLAWGGGAKRMKAAGTIKISWRSYDRMTRRLVWTRQIEEPFAFDHDAAGAPAVVAAAIASSADALARAMAVDAEKQSRPPD